MRFSQAASRLETLAYHTGRMDEAWRNGVVPRVRFDAYVLAVDVAGDNWAKREEVFNAMADRMEGMARL